LSYNLFCTTTLTGLISLFNNLQVGVSLSSSLALSAIVCCFSFFQKRDHLYFRINLITLNTYKNTKPLKEGLSYNLFCTTTLTGLISLFNNLQVGDIRVRHSARSPVSAQSSTNSATFVTFIFEEICLVKYFSYLSH
jgi:hypothetical protein